MNKKPFKLESRLDYFATKSPHIDSTSFIHPQSVLIGDVTIGKDSSIWPMAVLRGDINCIKIGCGSNVQDGTVIHLSDDFPVIIGDFVTIGHSAVIHACTIENECLIGMNATVMDGVVIGTQSIVAAGAVVPPGTKIPPGSLVSGVPAKVKKTLSQSRRDSIQAWAQKYVEVSKFCKKQKDFKPS